MRLSHTRTRRGNWVQVVLRNGEVIRDQFVERPEHKRWIVLKRRGRIPKNEIQVFTVLTRSQITSMIADGRIGSNH